MNASRQIVSNIVPNGDSSIKQEFSPRTASHVHTPAQMAAEVVILTRSTSVGMGREPRGYLIAGERGR